MTSSVHFVQPVTDPPRVKYNADVERIVIWLGSDVSAHLTVPDAVDLMDSIATALASAEGEEVKALVRDAERVQTEAEVREGLQ
ncbi:hypothetical protein P3H15_33265 [Rhodococcus sp. T2V]|uniref:hypothetical protein n=1 Tax=Rhodococcus sp. T2V TaxID=3034164 RepID=UPI0023E2CCFE|nr:hypothetical protein [Rhodococcus sp. T2V]MDF3309890.1 hypothetical protein [Rhodococcus sp. T2V]